MSNSESDQKILFLEDDSFFRDQWQRYTFRGMQFFSLESPIEFREKLNKGEFKIDDFAFLILDNQFAYPCVETGIEFARKVKQEGYKKPIFLASGGLYNRNELSDISLVVSKDPKVALAQLENYFSSLM